MSAAPAAALLAARARRTHRAAWSAVVVALALASLLLGAFALTVGATALGHARVERYAAADAVVAADQTTRYRARPWGGGSDTAEAALTERIRVPWHTVDLLRKVDGVRAAVPDSTFPVTVESADGGAAHGSSWEAARLAPYALRTGRAPGAADEVVVSAGHGASPGDRVRLRAGGEARTFTVVGVADGRDAVYFTAGEARRLSGHPGTVDAIGLLAEPGVNSAELQARVRDALDRARVRDSRAEVRAADDATALRVYTGDDRGSAEQLAAAPVRSALLALCGAVAGTVVLIAVLVIASLVAQALRQRAGELALLRAVGAAPRQLRAAVGREVLRVSVGPALLGAVASVPACFGILGLLRSGGALPSGFEPATPAWLFAVLLVTAGLTVGIARLAAFLGCEPIARARPAAALGATAAEPLRERPARRVTGLVLLALGVSAAGTATLQSGAVAAAAASAAALTMVVGCAVLGPWIARGATRVAAVPLRRFGGPAGRLAAAESASGARRLGAAITPVVLVTAFVLVQLTAGATLSRAGDEQAVAAMRADLAVTATGDGLPPGALDRLRGTPGVAAVNDVLRGTVVLAGREAGAPALERLPVLGVTPDALPRTLDPGLVEGSFADLGPGTVSVGRDRARSMDLHPGDRVRLRFGDGTERSPRVAAVHERSLALGEFLFARDELAAHLTAPRSTEVLIAASPGTDPSGLGARLMERLAADPARPDAQAPGGPTDMTLRHKPAPVRLVAEEQRAGEILAGVAVAAIGAFTVIAVLSTLTLIGVGRRPALRLLRLVGAGRSQLRGMLCAEAALVAVAGLVVGAGVAAVPLAAFSFATARTVPYLPPLQGLLIVGVVAVTAAAGTLLPVRRALR
ncbi:FtsX-like permease family protein [Streptomyces sp. CFMR 7]|uniref:FtsX-like permease family protein n=1 Tax=Streptomyces sp. CFMR 7 TaxID=1649184 RepID=UPI0006AD560E|nr:FtsX-like permease family protein [Streptomyces sp. CFMR 7]ALC25804.1 ABC transporter permease [Streptomyces sp. CFMR 7]